MQEILTEDEKQKLYDAIGYEENAATDLPKEVCCLWYFPVKIALLHDAVLVRYLMWHCVCLSVRLFTCSSICDKMVLSHKQQCIISQGLYNFLTPRSWQISSGIIRNGTLTHNERFYGIWILSGTTRTSQYQKKHSPTHTYRGLQSYLICFLHLL